MANVFHQFPALLTELDVEPRHLLHVGAHEGQEVPYYRQAGIEYLTLVEPIPDLATMLRLEHPDARVVEAACGTTDGWAELHIPRLTNMATLQDPQPQDGPTRVIPVPVVTVAELQAETDPQPNMLVVDAQGRELDVLRSAVLDGVDLVVAETVTVPDPTMAALYGEVSAYMLNAGFVEHTRWERDQDWVAEWARGRGQPRTGGRVLDVVFVKGQQP